MPGKSLLRNGLSNQLQTYCFSAVQPSLGSPVVTLHDPGQINDGQLDTEYRLYTHARMIASSKRAELASYRTLWIVHRHYRGTVKSKYVDIAISFAQPSQEKYNYHDMIIIIIANKYQC